MGSQLHFCKRTMDEYHEANKKKGEARKSALTYIEGRPKTLEEAFINPDPNMGNLHTGFGVISKPYTEEDLKSDVFIEYVYRVELFESGNVEINAFASGSKGFKKLVNFTFWQKEQRLIEHGKGTDSKQTLEQVLEVIEK